MTREEITRVLAGILRDVAEVDPHRVGENTAFTQDLELDSLTLVKVVVTAEDSFAVTITDEQAQRLRTVADAVTFIQDALEHRAAAAQPAPGRRSQAPA
jgi:acyl carrier protein